MARIPSTRQHRRLADLKRVFVGNFQGTYAYPRNSWDLKSCQQEPNESLRDYICRFSKRYNSLPVVVNVDVISAFLSRTTCESLIHKLGYLKPRTTRDLLDVATNHASGEEAVRAVFNGGWDKGKAKREDQDETPSTQRGKKNKKDRRRSDNTALVIAADRTGK